MLNLKETVAKIIVSDSSNVSTNIKKGIGKSNRDFYSSNENSLHLMNGYYFHNVLGKREYLSLCKANKQSTFENMQIVNFVSYKNCQGKSIM